ncbi:hypothetical protein [Sphingomonas faeni]|uniref:hypothetical protein n=1 Tax=Sphingomonas faeni TaxID=185950 RepID=UPI002780D41D|nr:hypothetical protein [Sphingomonas faeni]MDQ0839999.1 hypothetical protein [Sphingomonas faeni]
MSEQGESKNMRHRLGTVAFAGMIALATGAAAQGLATRDLTGVSQAAAAALGSGFEAKEEPQRATLFCTDCVGAPVVDVLIGRQADGTEERVRSGTTSIADLQQICRARSPRCTVTALEVAPAVGWVSGYPLGDRAGATAIIIRDGDLLTVRSLAQDPASARQAIDRLLPLIRTRIIGP